MLKIIYSLVNSRSMKRRLISVLTSFVFTVGILAACGGGETQADCSNLDYGESVSQIDEHYAIVLAPTDNFISMQSALASGNDELDMALSRNHKTKKISVIVADAHPRVVLATYADFTNVVEDSQSEQIVSDVKSALLDVADCLNRTDGSGIKVAPESDVLGAIQVAGNAVGSDPESSRIFVYGNGLQTAGNLRLQEGFPTSESEVNSLVDQLRNSIPPAIAQSNLNETRVTWVGLGQVANSETNPLNTQSGKILVDLWRSLLVNSGAVLKDGDIKLGTVPDEYGVSDGSIKVSSVTSLEATCYFLLNLPQDKLGFKDESSQFLNEEEARNVAKSVAKQLAAKNCGTPITLTGYVASGTSKTEFEKNPNAGVGLSQRRAEAFKRLLLEEGVDVPITAIGKGKGPVYDWDDQGNEVEKLQAKNRIVVVKQ